MLDPWFRVSQPLRHLRKLTYWRLVEYRVVRDAAAVIFTCEEERRLGRTTFQPWKARREEIIPLGTHPPPAEAAELAKHFFERFPALEGKRLLLFLGRLHEKKGCDLLLAAFRRTKPPLHLVFAGPGIDSAFGSRLRVLADGLPVSFLGPLYERDKWAALAAAEAFILPSHQENFGIAVAEALASGLPVLISNKVNTWTEITAANAGFVEPDNADGTSRLIERWLSADQPAMRAAALRCFAERFDIRRTAANLVALLRSTQP
jgi:glycosyltransferase involved in cell wall biosynthesis